MNPSEDKILLFTFVKFTEYKLFEYICTLVSNSWNVHNMTLTYFAPQPQIALKSSPPPPPSSLSSLDFSEA